MSVVNVVDLAGDGGGRAVVVRRALVILALQARLDNLIGPCQELSFSFAPDSRCCSLVAMESFDTYQTPLARFFFDVFVRT